MPGMPDDYYYGSWPSSSKPVRVPSRPARRYLDRRELPVLDESTTMVRQNTSVILRGGGPPAWTDDTTGTSQNSPWRTLVRRPELPPAAEPALRELQTDAQPRARGGRPNATSGTTRCSQAAVRRFDPHRIRPPGFITLTRRRGDYNPAICRPTTPDRMLRLRYSALPDIAMVDERCTAGTTPGGRALSRSVDETHSAAIRQWLNNAPQTHPLPRITALKPSSELVSRRHPSPQVTATLLHPILPPPNTDSISSTSRGRLHVNAIELRLLSLRNRQIGSAWPMERTGSNLCSTTSHLVTG